VLTDFGTADEFAGVVRAVLLRVAPGCPVLDLTHEIPAFDVRAGALALERSVPHLGPGVVMAVVDPGVGTSRRAVAVSVGARADGPGFLVGPDNGVLGFAMDALGGATAAVELRRTTRVGGATFDARDVFAPAAARLWSGSALEDLGSRVDSATLVRLASPHLEILPGALETEVLWVDRFGNVQLAARPGDSALAGIAAPLPAGIPGETAGEAVVVSPRGEFEFQSGTSFLSEAEEALGPLPGTSGPHHTDQTSVVRLITDSNGRLALVCPRRSAATVLGVQSGDVLTLRNREPGVPGGGRAAT